MASLLDRRDIHKGVIALENIASAFFDYAQAAKASVLSQRRLTKCLREVANVKGNPPIANTAFAASAWILDAITGVDAKFALIMEREYETLSAELRKWFKRLAKEEKDHDEYTNVRQNKIRQAGERYEKRALKRDVGEEHNRYINLLNTLGAEISEAQAAHAHSVNHRHTTVMFSIGACISRLADASWIRTCEGVKHCAPGIGRVGEARVFCETGWLGNAPNDLADLSNPHLSLEDPNSLSGRLSPSANTQSPSHLSETQTSNSPAAFVPPDPLHEAQHLEELEEPRLYGSPPRQAFISTTSRKTSPSDWRILNQSSDTTAIPEYYTSNLPMDRGSYDPVLEDPSPPHSRSADLPLALCPMHHHLLPSRTLRC
ncbi:hypothetical protein BS47DRAFT_568739 [Hydnum rufescens UP504]|uniref:IMD domain-containing protein n=1 Tax=Hydnum rufescens UP504 TaxID=1448309 RepID=A0A9P6DX56_9AGAM|nr:hypothetical protein BS47DRAFT_568739 [Hydnum rufescens UP504]